MSNDTIKQRLYRWIDDKMTSLPDTADGIAAYLKSRGIVGYKDSANQCPLACYFKGELSKDLHDIVPNRRDWLALSPLIDEISVGLQLLRIDAHVDKVVVTDKHLTGAAADFVRAFDADEYPHLVYEDDYAL